MTTKSTLSFSADLVLEPLSALFPVGTPTHLPMYDVNVGTNLEKMRRRTFLEGKSKPERSQRSMFGLFEDSSWLDGFQAPWRSFSQTKDSSDKGMF